jgi:ATP-binding cassette, subfamily B, bacterial PglK
LKAKKESAFLQSLRLLSQQDRVKILAVIILQSLLGFLDLVGIALIGLVGALSVTGVQSTEPGGRVQWILENLRIENLQFQNQVAIIGLAAAFILVGRTLVSAIFMRKTLYFLSRRGALISASLVRKVLSQPLLTMQARTNQETVFALTTGVQSITVGVLGTFVLLVADFSLLLVMAVGLLIVNWTMAIGTLVVFTGVAWTLYRFMYMRAQTLGAENARLSIESNEKIIEVLVSYRESIVRSRRDFYAKEIASQRFALADTEAELSFMPNVSKYAFEITIVLGGLGIGAVQFLTQDATQAVATLSIFLAAGMRIAPAVLRIQQGSIQIRRSLGNSTETLKVMHATKDVTEIARRETSVEFTHDQFEPIVNLSKVTFRYPDSNQNALDDVNLKIPQGSLIAIVGPSGSGKSTLVDILLGVLEPTSGSVEVSGVSVKSAIDKWPGAISYVPQEITIVNGTIKENIALGYPNDDYAESAVIEALRLSQLHDFVASLPAGPQTQVGERGARLSGGQRQRLGIARALFTRPKLLVLDEATSSLDGQTELDLSSAINQLKGRVTVVLIAHRLSTIRNADQVIYLERGRVIASGSIEHVRSSVKEFDTQATLMGL